MKKLLTTISCSLLAIASMAQRPDPAPAQQKPIALMNGVAHLGTGEVIENSAILFADGKIQNVVDATRARLDLSGYEVIQIDGKHVYPGFILPYSNLGLREIDAVRATVDERETGSFNPNVRSLIAFNTDSDIIPTVRANGVLLVQTTPRGGLISGSSSVMQLDAWNWEDAVVKADDGLWMNWPSMYRRSGWWAEPGPVEKNKRYDEQKQEIRTFLTDAQTYGQTTPEVKNLKLEAMQGVFDGTQQLYIKADEAKEIVEAVQLAKSFKIPNVVIVGGEDTYLVKELLKEHEVPVLLADLHRLPSRTADDVDLPYKLPGMLTKAGLKVGLLYDELRSNRNLPFFAGTAAGYGLSKEEALQLITKNTAEILGIGEQYGTLEEGKSATLFVSEGDALDMRTNQVIGAFIDGRQISLDNKQLQLYEQYSEKYGHQKEKSTAF